jgi:hypothetical protein
LESPLLTCQGLSSGGRSSLICTTGTDLRAKEEWDITMLFQRQTGAFDVKTQSGCESRSLAPRSRQASPRGEITVRRAEAIRWDGIRKQGVIMSEKSQGGPMPFSLGDQCIVMRCLPSAIWMGPLSQCNSMHTDSVCIEPRRQFPLVHRKRQRFHSAIKIDSRLCSVKPPNNSSISSYRNSGFRRLYSTVFHPKP